MTTLTRRDLLKLAGLTLAAAPRFGSFAWAAGRDDSFPTPPMLPLSRPEPGLVEGEIFAAWARVPVAGTTARLQTYNGAFPGPTLRLHEGERVRLRFTNLLDEPTNLHLHGLRIPPAVDDPFRSLEPGDSFVYEFVVPRHSAGTYWYHPHMHGQVAKQLFAGLAGAILVDPRSRTGRLHLSESHLVVLKDLTLQGDAPAPHTILDWMSGKEGDLVLVNGALQPVLRTTRGSIRLRIVNASNARYYRLGLDGHPMLLVATDGGLIDTPVSLGELLLAPGERAEVLVPLEGADRLRLQNLPYDRGSGMGAMHGGHAGSGMGGMHPPVNLGGSAPQTLLTVEAAIDSPRLPLPRRLAGVERLDPGAATVVRHLALGMTMMGRGFTINGRTFDENRIDFHGSEGDLEIWEIENRTAMDHPFHLHTYSFQVLTRDGVPDPFPAWKDVVNVRAGEVVRLAVPLRDFTGKTVFHCHIVEHEDLGMMGVLAV
jgi:FtsP/CotA-like multicopper oxidase with cupredoxin domain